MEPTGKAFAATAACTTVIRLADTRRRHNRPRYRPHHAPTDALASAELLQAQIAHRFGPERRSPNCGNKGAAVLKLF